MYMCVYVCMYVCMYVYVYIYIHAYLHKYIHFYLAVSMCYFLNKNILKQFVMQRDEPPRSYGK